MTKKYKLTEVADAVREVLREHRMRDSTEMGEALRERGIYYEHRTLLGKLRQIKNTYSWLNYYWSNGYIWYSDEYEDKRILKIITKKYSNLFNQWLASNPKDSHYFKYFHQLGVLKELIDEIDKTDVDEK